MTISNLWSSIRRGVSAALTRWQRNEEHRRLVGRGQTDADLLAVQTGHTPGVGEVGLRLGSNTRQMLAAADVSVPSTPEAAAILAQIGEACTHCPDWERCRRWLEAGAQGKAYLEFCPNVVRFAELKALSEKAQVAD
ncbi:MAG: DUF6455 family protein [Acidiferrobacterales bacterium]